MALSAAQRQEFIRALKRKPVDWRIIKELFASDNFKNERVYFYEVYGEVPEVMATPLELVYSLAGYENRGHDFIEIANYIISHLGEQFLRETMNITVFAQYDCYLPIIENLVNTLANSF